MNAVPPLGRPPEPVRVSFEFFPPKSSESEAALWDSIGRLAPLTPDLVPGTSGAGGPTRQRTHATGERLVR